MARILVIDDNHDNLELIRYLLDAFGHDAITARDGASGIAAAARERPELIVCDIHMPGTDGFAVLQAVRADPASSRVPVLAVTALAMNDDRERGLAAGFDAYVSKPIDPAAFIEQLHRFLRPDRHGMPRSQAVAPAGPTVAQQPGSCIASVLVVDDLATNRELMTQMLTPLGYQVRTAADAEEALRLAQDAIPDLVVTDVHMPGTGGMELVRALKALPRLAPVPVIVITSSAASERQRQAALQLGASRFIARPIEPQRLLDEVSACLSDGGKRGDDPGR